MSLLAYFDLVKQRIQSVTQSDGLPVGGVPLMEDSFTRGASATQYSISDIFSQGATTEPLRFYMKRPQGRIYGARCAITAASGTVVVTALTFDLLLFRGVQNIPFEPLGYPADNAALAVSAAAMEQLIGTLAFGSGSWRNKDGLATASGTVLWQPAAPATRPFFTFNLEGAPRTGKGWEIRGINQMQAVWNPGNVAQRCHVVLDVDYV